MVEKIKRDVRITTIYEGTSEIMEMTIGRDRWQQHLKTRGQHYHELARELEALAGAPPDVGAGVAALALHALAEVLERCRVGRLTRHQHVLFRARRADRLSPRARRASPSAPRAPRKGELPDKADRRFDADGAGGDEPRLRARRGARRWPRTACVGRGARRRTDAATCRPSKRALGCAGDPRAQAGLIADMDLVADVLYGRVTRGACRRAPGRRTNRSGHPWMTRSPRVAVVGVGAILPDAPDAAAFWENVNERSVQHHRGPARPLGPGALLRPRPERARQDLLEDRRLGPRVRVGPDEVAACRSRRGSPTRWTTARSGRSPAPREALADYGWPGAAARPRPDGGDPRQRDGGREALPHLAADRTSRCSRASWTELRPSRPCPPRRARRSSPSRTSRSRSAFPEITEDTMPGELANIIAGRVANLFNLHGPNYITDAACASAMAAIERRHRRTRRAASSTPSSPAASTATWAPPTFVKFCKIGALSATGTRPYADGADGFVMGEGAAFFLLKRLADAERDGDRIYAVHPRHRRLERRQGQGHHRAQPGRASGSRSGAPGERGARPGDRVALEAHGTSTRVGDVVEVESLAEVFGAAGLAGPDRSRSARSSRTSAI